MKARVNPKTECKEFRPFEFVIGVETIQEARLLYHICNHNKIRDLIKEDALYGFEHSPDIAESMGSIWEIIKIIKKEITNQGFKI
jgi:hypothetical protein